MSPLIWLGKVLKIIINCLKLGSGSTWPGHIILKIYPHFIKRCAPLYPKGILVIAGTNGKTTTARLLATFLQAGSLKITSNEAGANLLNGVASLFLQDFSLRGRPRSEMAILEVDEGTLPYLLAEISPRAVILLNLFRDQLDRYGEIDSIAEKWSHALRKLPSGTTFLLNGDDPTLAALGTSLKSKPLFFGLADPSLFLKTPQGAADSLFCRRCGSRLNFRGVYFSHLGEWSCPGCKFAPPKRDITSREFVCPLPGVYNRYNLAAAALAALFLGVTTETIKGALTRVSPAFGRLEEFRLEGKKVRLLLSKNPTGFNESLRTVQPLPGEVAGVLLVLSDQIPDGRDISWIWDVDFEAFIKSWRWVVVSGRRASELGLRLKYATLNGPGPSLVIQPNLRAAISLALEKTPLAQRLNILPTYSAMLEVRQILRGRKLL